MQNTIKRFFTGALIILVLAGMLTACGPAKPKGELQYYDILEICCEAMNKGNKRLISDFIYDGFGEEWNKEYIYDGIKFVHDEYIDEYGPVKPVVENYWEHSSTSELEDLKEWIFSKTGRIILDLELGLEMDIGYVEVFLVKIDGTWHILYIDG